MRFSKYQGLGNDFVVIDERSRSECSLTTDARRKLCHRHLGIGADGVLTLLTPSAGAIARMHVTNADGSVAQMCGNGLRCVSLWLLQAGVVEVEQEHIVQTDAGPRSCRVLALPVDGASDVRVEMGPALWHGPGAPAWFREPLVLQGGGYRASALSMGNPHLVLEADADLSLAARLGPVLEIDPRFPERTNVELASLRADGSIDVVVWERGVGLTQACGTGACAVVAAFARAGKVPFDEDVMVHLPGGSLRVRVPSREGPLWMTGPARRVFGGEV